MLTEPCFSQRRAGVPQIEHTAQYLAPTLHIGLLLALRYPLLLLQVVRQVYLPMLTEQALGKSGRLDSKGPSEMVASLERFSTHLDSMIHELQGVWLQTLNSSNSSCMYDTLFLGLIMMSHI